MLQGHPFQKSIAVQGSYHTAGLQRNIFPHPNFILVDGRGSEGISSVDKMHLGNDFTQVQGFFKSGIPPADDPYYLIFKEIAIT